MIFSHGLAAIGSQYPGAHLFDFEHLNGHDLEVGTGATSAAAGLVDHYFAVGKDEATSFSPPLRSMLPMEAAIPMQTVATGEDHLHGIIDDHATGDHAAGLLMKKVIFSRVQCFKGKNRSVMSFDVLSSTAPQRNTLRCSMNFLSNIHPCHFSIGLSGVAGVSSSSILMFLIGNVISVCIMSRI